MTENLLIKGVGGESVVIKKCDLWTIPNHLIWKSTW